MTGPLDVALRAQTPTLDEIGVASIFITTSIGTATASLPVFIAPFPCQIVQAEFVSWNQTATITQSDTNYWAIEVRRYHITTATTIASGVNTSSTALANGQTIVQRTVISFDNAIWVPGITLAENDVAAFALLATGTPSVIGPNVNFTLRYIPV